MTDKLIKEVTAINDHFNPSLVEGQDELCIWLHPFIVAAAHRYFQSKAEDAAAKGNGKAVVVKKIGKGKELFWWVAI